MYVIDTSSLWVYCFVVFFFKQKTAYEMRISDWSSDVCSSDLRSRLRKDLQRHSAPRAVAVTQDRLVALPFHLDFAAGLLTLADGRPDQSLCDFGTSQANTEIIAFGDYCRSLFPHQLPRAILAANRSEEHTSELQSPMRISSAVFCLKQQ